MLDHIIKQGVYDSPFVGIEVSDADGRIMKTNPFFREILGYRESELATLTIGDLCHAEDRACEHYRRRQLLEGKIDHLNFRKRYLAKSGKTIWGDTSITAVHDSGDNGPVLVASMVDATEKRRRELLQQGQSRVLDLLYRDHSLEEVCEAIVESIEAVEEGLLCSILQLNAKTGTLHKVAAPSLPDFYNEAIEGMEIGEGVGSCGAAAFRGQRVVVTDILEHPNWARARRLVSRTSLRSCWSQPIFSNTGRVLGTFAIYYNEPREPGQFELDLITSAAELTALAINHKQALSALQMSNQLKSEFISTAAHELRTPISSIMGYAELLRQMQILGLPQTDQNSEFLDLIVEKSEMLSRIIGDLLDISRIENGYRLGLQKKPTSILKSIDKVLGYFEQNAPQHVFSLRTIGVIPETIQLDEGRIIQVLDNLLSNAVKYSPAGGLIELVIEGQEGQMRVSVTDRGIGMSNDQLERVFDKFYRANANDSAVQGLGLGMSIVREIIEAHGGEIEVTSAPGEGTQVRFSLPRDENMIRLPAETSNTGIQSRHQGLGKAIVSR